MFIGRIGVLTFRFALLQQKDKKTKRQRDEEMKR